MLEKLGAEVQHVHHVTKKSKRIPFDPNTIDYVLTFSDHVPNLLVHTCKAYGKRILTREWLVQCVINNVLLDADSPLFLYMHSSVDVAEPAALNDTGVCVSDKKD